MLTRFLVLNSRFPTAGDCDDPGAPANGGRVRLGDVVTFSCQRGYRLVGEPSITCTSAGVWSAPRPFCDENEGLSKTQVTILATTLGSVFLLLVLVAVMLAVKGKSNSHSRTRAQPSHLAGEENFFLCLSSIRTTSTLLVTIVRLPTEDQMQTAHALMERTLSNG